MKLFQDIRRSIRNDRVSILYREWNTSAEGSVTDLVERVEEIDPLKVKSRWEAEVLSSGKPQISRLEDHWYMAQPFFPEERLIILGGGHVALPLTAFAAAAGFPVTLVDDRPEFASRARFPDAREVICAPFGEALTRLKIRSSDYVCILTRGHSCDEDCLRILLRGVEARYLGMIGSRRRVAMVRDRMLAEGCEEERWNRLHSPIGLPIGGITPAEIAVSILAELIACRRKGDNRGTASMDQDIKVMDVLAAEERGFCLLTVIASEGSVPRGAGAMMILYEDGTCVGSIGGGSGEAIAMKEAMDLMGTGRSVLRELTLNQDAAARDGLVCGGKITVLIQNLG